MKSLFDPRAALLITDVVAYGSAVFKQQENVASMKDLLVIVQNAALFHKHQLETNGQHYAPWMSSALATALNRLPARVFFNTGVRSSKGELFKYGVIEHSDFVDDCLSWRNLYAAGRLHKPVLHLTESTPELNGSIPESTPESTPESNSESISESIRNAVLMNRIYALRVALLVHDLKCGSDAQWSRLFQTIIGLSYHGDVRMAFAENPRKIQNILAAQEEAFYSLYRPLLPSSLSNCADLPAMLANVPREPSALLKSCRQIVRKNSFIQTAKGLLTARPAVTCSYAWRKITKRFL